MNDTDAKFVNPARYKKVPRLMLEDGGEVIDTIWEIGEGKMYVSNGTKKPSRKGARFLGQVKIEGGSLSIEVHMLRVFPSDRRDTVTLSNPDLCKLLSAAYMVSGGGKKVEP